MGLVARLACLLGAREGAREEEAEGAADDRRLAPPLPPALPTLPRRSIRALPELALRRRSPSNRPEPRGRRRVALPSIATPLPRREVERDDRGERVAPSVCTRCSGSIGGGALALADAPEEVTALRLRATSGGLEAEEEAELGVAMIDAALERRGTSGGLAALGIAPSLSAAGSVACCRARDGACRVGRVADCS